MSLLVISTLVLLASVTISAHAQNNAKFAGEWNAVTDKGEKFVLTFYLRAPEYLAGGYSTSGRIYGPVKDNILRFTWKIGDQSGAGRLTFASDGLSFRAILGSADDPDDLSGGAWSGTRPPSFAGVWHGKLGEGFMETILGQSGDRVTGQLKVNSAEFGMIKDAVMAGRTLRFVLVRMVVGAGGRMREEYVGTGEFVLDSSGRSFSGTILGAAASGTFITR
jgi:hypothetical protein